MTTRPNNKTFPESPARSKRGSTKPQLTPEQFKELQNLPNQKDGSAPIMILKRRISQSTMRLRYDVNGVQIKRGARKHNIAFKQELTEVFLVESWKKYNLDNEELEQKCCRLF